MNANDHEYRTRWLVSTYASEWPTCLMLTPTGEPGMPSYTRSNYTRHNAAVQAWHKSSVGAMARVSDGERSILGLLDALTRWIALNEPDPYNAEHVVAPILTAIGNAFNLDMGRLNGGVLSGYVCWLGTRYGLDVDTGEWVGMEA